MPCRDFTANEAVDLCFQIAFADNILFEEPKRKLSLFKRNAFEKSPPRERKISAIARKISLVKGIPKASKAGTSEESSLYEKISEETRIQRLKQEQSDIVGLGGRGVVAVAILCNENGMPFRTYTEDDDIPVEEIDSADKIFLSRIPRTRVSESSDTSSEYNNENLKPLVTVLAELESEKRDKLLKKLVKTLDKLHTTDFNTASSFLKIDKYRNIRSSLKQLMIEFLSKELKITIYSNEGVKAIAEA